MKACRLPCLTLLLLALAGVSRTKACRCVPDALNLTVSLQNSDAAAKVNVGSEITPANADINDSRYWKGEVVDVFKGCTLTKDIVIETGGNGALCGVELKDLTSYLLIGWASVKLVEAFNYEYLVISINSCTLQKEWETVTDEESAALYSLKNDCPVKTVKSCETCPHGFFDGCNDCACGDDGLLVGCTKRACPTTVPPEEPRCFEKERQCCDPMQSPGFGSDFAGCKGEGFRCCPDGQWSCSIGDGKTFPCGGELVTTGFSEPCNTPIVCPVDVKTCSGGGIVSRDPQNECRFPECEKRLCATDVMTCPDGSFVARDSENGCTFKPCPTPPVACATDVKICYDGSASSRDPNNGCEFMPCPPPSCANCPYGFDDGCNQCACKSKTSKPVCTERACLVQGEPKCNPAGGCSKDLFKCPSGDKVGRDPKNKCKFAKCPLPKGCSELKGCFLVDLTTKKPFDKVKLQGTTKYNLVTGKSRHTILCQARGPLDRMTFSYPDDGFKERRSPPYYMGDTKGNSIRPVPFLGEGCGRKKITVEGHTTNDRCFTKTFELEAVC